MVAPDWIQQQKARNGPRPSGASLAITISSIWNSAQARSRNAAGVYR
jgi:hypothetical protein